MSEINPDKAAGVTVPAEAVEAATKAVYELRIYGSGRPRSADEIADAALAAAAPLLVADRDAEVERLVGVATRLTAERNTAIEETDLIIAERDDYAARLRATDKSWTRVAAERDAAVEATRQGIAAAIRAGAVALHTDCGELAAGIARGWTP